MNSSILHHVAVETGCVFTLFDSRLDHWVSFKLDPEACGRVVFIMDFLKDLSIDKVRNLAEDA